MALALALAPCVAALEEDLREQPRPAGWEEEAVAEPLPTMMPAPTMMGAAQIARQVGQARTIIGPDGKKVTISAGVNPPPMRLGGGVGWMF